MIKLQIALVLLCVTKAVCSYILHDFGNLDMFSSDEEWKDAF